MRAYKSKIKNKTLKSGDVGILIDKINLLIKEKNEGHIEFSDDDVKQLGALKFLLKKYEENKEDVSFATRDEHLSHHKIESIVNELELNQIITYVSKAIGGHFYFKITDKIRFRNYLYKLVEEILNKLPEKEFNFLKKVNWYNPYIVTIVGSVIASLIFLFLAFLFSWPPFTPKELPELPQIDFGSVSFFPNTFGCFNNIFDIDYKVAHVDGGSVGFGQPYYVFVNQTRNSCLENFTFFNNTPSIHLMCDNTFYRGDERVEACDPDFDPINKETIRIIAHQGMLSSAMTETFNKANVSSCDLTEQVKLCVLLSGQEYCSPIQNVDLNFDCRRE